MAEYITTFSGINFYPLDPDPEGILIEDVAHSLARLCRANGHYNDFYSVAAHCINCYEEACARSESVRVRLACLLHDAAEAYISDIPRPVKMDLDGIDTIENRLLSMIYTKFLGSDLTEYEAQTVKVIDDAMLYYEFYEFSGIRLIEEFPYVATTPLFYDDTIRCVEEQYLEIFHALDPSKEAPKTVTKLRLKGAPEEERVPLRLKEEPADSTDGASDTV